MWPLGLVPYQDEGPPKLAVFDQFGPQNTHSWVLKTPGLPSKNPQGVEIIFGPLYNDFSVNLVDFKNVIHCLNNFRQMTRTAMVDRSRWGRGGGGGGRGDNSSDTSSTSSGFPGAGRGWSAHPAPRRPIWASSVDRSPTPSDKAVAWRDTQKEEVDRLTESKSFLRHNKSFTSSPSRIPLLGYCIHPVGLILKSTLSSGLAIQCLRQAQGRARKEDAAATAAARESLTNKAMARVILVRLVQKILFNHESSWLRVDAQIRSENELIYSRD